jgi:hypothetical protein
MVSKSAACLIMMQSRTNCFTDEAWFYKTLVFTIYVVDIDEMLKKALAGGSGVMEGGGGRKSGVCG